MEGRIGREKEVVDGGRMSEERWGGEDGEKERGDGD